MDWQVQTPAGTKQPTSAEAMLVWAERVPDRTAFRFIAGDGTTTSIDYGNLAKRATRLSAGLAEISRPNDRILLVFQQSLDFIIAFQACQMAGLIPVPVSPPRGREHNNRLEGIIADCQPRAILTHHDRAKALRARSLGLDILEIATVETAGGGDATRPRATLAFLQYTSGSTGSPRGVMVSHDHLAANIRAIKQAFDINENSESVTWLPTYHDMGLVSTLIPMFVGRMANLMAPEDFMRNPLSWITNISRFGADISGGPNFAFDVCARKLLASDLSPLSPEQIDLSRWRVAFVGAEPVHADTLAQFARAAAPFGFNPGAFFPCYGLAEATLYVSGCGGTPGRVSRGFVAESLRQGRAVPAIGAGKKMTEIGEPAPVHLVSCGRLSRESDSKVIIVDPTTRRQLADGQIGEIWVAGPGVAGGYWNAPEPSATAFRAHLDQGDERHYLRTGDLGFVLDRNLYINGRISDVIIINGVNHFPQDLELTAASAHPALPMWRSAAFALEDDGQAKIVVFQEMPMTGRRSLESSQIISRIREAIFDQHGIALHDVVLLNPGGLPATSSGKVRRRYCRTLYEKGQHAQIAFNSQSRPGLDAAGANADEMVRQSVVTRSQGSAPFTQAMRTVLSEVLNIPVGDVDVTAPINRYRIDSLRTLEIQILLESKFGLRVAAESLQGATPIDMLAISTRAEGPATAGAFWADAALAPSLLPATERKGAGDILITGATGFLGSHLVKALAERSEARIVCLVRAHADRTAVARLADGLRDAGLPADILDRRIEAIEGDLSKPRLGLSENLYTRLAENVGSIYHNAAVLDFLRPYEALKAVNVEPCRALLELASVGGRKRIVHISSISTLETPVRAGQWLDENTILDFPETLSAGYAQSKWVADMMLTHARERGFDVAIFRPPWIVGPAPRSGEGSGDFLEHFLKGCISIGAMPESTYRWNVVTVAFVAQAVAALSLSPSPPPAVCHLGLAEGVDNQSIVRSMATETLELELLPVEQWRKRLWDSLSVGGTNPLRPLAPLFFNAGPGRAAADPYLDDKIPRMDSRATLAKLAALGIDPPTFDVRSFIRAMVLNGRSGEPKNG